MFASLYLRLGVLAVACALIFGLGYKAYNHVYDKGAASVQVLWDKVEADRNAVIADLKSKAALSELTMKTESDKQLRLLNDKNKTLTATVATITRELQSRPDRPSSSSADVSGSPTTPAGPTGATGQELYRPDAEFLIGEAARAEKLGNDLEYCINKYNSVYTESLKFQSGK